MTSNVKLLPCPWCGEALASVSVSEGSTFRWRKVGGCCADGPEVRHDTMADDQVAAEVESRAKAITAWNTRANVIHHTAPLQYALDNAARDIKTLREVRDAHIAEIEALRAWWIRAEGQLAACDSDLHAMQRRAERLAEAGRRVTAAFRAHGEASSFTRQAERTRHECEAAMLSLADALRDHEQEVGNWTCEMRPNA